MGMSIFIKKQRILVHWENTTIDLYFPWISTPCTIYIPCRGLTKIYTGNKTNRKICTRSFYSGNVDPRTVAIQDAAGIRELKTMQSGK